MINTDQYHQILSELKTFKASLVAVSKTKSIEDIWSLHALGQNDFGENYVQELTGKQEALPELNWHFIGHLQSNKIKFIAPFISMIHGIDSVSTLSELNRQASKTGRQIDCLLQIHIAQEESKFGFSFEEAEKFLSGKMKENLSSVNIKGFMGMATLTDDEKIIRMEFRALNSFFDRFRSKDFSILSMGMTSDYKIALEEGSNLVRIGSAIFGERN